jgi:hypothetical protein
MSRPAQTRLDRLKPIPTYKGTPLQSINKKQQTNMVDYSKWDRFEDSSDDDEEENNNEDRFTSPNPRVTRLEAPSTITTHADGTIHIKTTDAATARVVGVESSPREKGFVVKGDSDAAGTADNKPAAPGKTRTIRFVDGQPAASKRIKEDDDTISRTTAGGNIPASKTVPAHWTAQGSRRRLERYPKWVLMMMITGRAARLTHLRMIMTTTTRWTFYQQTDLRSLV